MEQIEVEGEKNKSKIIVGNINTILGTYYAQGALLGIGYVCSGEKEKDSSGPQSIGEDKC